MNYENIITKSEKRSDQKEKLLKKSIKHWYGDIWRKINELQLANPSKSMREEMVLKPMWLTTSSMKKLKKKSGI